MCSTSVYDLEDIPLEDDDPNSIEFKILAFYARHHVFKSTSTVLSPKLSRTKSLSQKALGTWSTDSWTQVSSPCRSSPSSEKYMNLGKKKSSWKTFFGVTLKEEGLPSSLKEAHAQGPKVAERQGLFQNQRARSLSSVERRLESEALDPKVASIANRVAEIVYSWPPPEDSHSQGGGFKFKDSVAPEIFFLQGRRPQLSGGGPKRDGDDQIIGRIVELLKCSGDDLERELRKDKALKSSLQERLTYTFFKTITDLFLRDVDTRGESEIKAQGFKAALAIDAMAKLTAIDNHPMNRVLGFGTKYLKEHFSPWVQQNGGWEKILGVSHEEVD